MLNGRFWVQTFIATIVTMMLIVVVKKVSEKYNVPGLKQLSENV